MNQTRLDEIRKIVRSSRDVKGFYESFLETVAGMLNARVGVAWNCTSTPFHLICQIQAKATPPTRLAISEHQHMELLNRASRNQRSFIVQPRLDDKEQDPEHPVLMFGPIRRNSEIELVEFILPNEKDQEACKVALQELDYFCGLAASFEEQPDDRGVPAATVNSTESFQPLTRESLDQLVHALHESLDYRETAHAIANESRRALDCDRVSVVIRKGAAFRLLAISGQPSVNRRSNLVHALSLLSTRTLKTRQPFWYPGDEPLLPQIEEPLNEYLGFSATRSMAILPIFDRSVAENREAQDQATEPEVIAGLIIEHCNEQWNHDKVAANIESVSRHAADAMRNALEHRQLFGYSLWRLLGKSRIMASARNLPKSLAVLATLIVLTVVLTVVPAPFTLHSEGVLLPRTRRKVFSEIEGKVDSIHVQHGSQVEPGAALLTLANEDLAIQIEEIKGQIAGLEEKLEGNRISRVANRGSRDQELMLENSRAMKSEIASLKKRQELLTAKSRKLTVSSPIQGEIITWDVADRLRSRPVKVGDLLMEVADIDGEWEIELELPDRRIGHLLREFEKQKQMGDGQGIAVTYQLAADPSSKYKGRIKQIAQATQLNADNQQSIRVVVEINTDDIDSIRQARSGVSARIHCGYEPLGYVWLHDVFEFVQSKVLFRIW